MEMRDTPKAARMRFHETWPGPAIRHHDELALGEPEEDAADNLAGRLSTLAGGFFERFGRLRVLEETVGDSKLVQGLRRGRGGGHAGEYTTTWIRGPREVLKGFLDSDQGG